MAKGRERAEQAAAKTSVERVCPLVFFFSSSSRHTRLQGDWSSDVCSSDLQSPLRIPALFPYGRGLRGQRSASLWLAVSQASRLPPRATVDRLANMNPPPDDGREAIRRQIGRASCGKECRSRWSPYH